MSKKRIKKRVMSREEREDKRAELRLFLYKKGAKQYQANSFEMLVGGNTFRYDLRNFGCIKWIQRCDFSRGKVMNKRGKMVRAPKRLGRAGNHNPYWWEEASLARYCDLDINFKKLTCKGFIRY